MKSQNMECISRDSHIIEREIEVENSIFNKAISLCRYFEAVNNDKSITQHIDGIKNSN